MLRAGEFALTRLAAGIVESYLEDEIADARESNPADPQPAHQPGRDPRLGPARPKLPPTGKTARRSATARERQRLGERYRTSPAASLDLEQQAFQARIAKLLESGLVRRGRSGASSHFESTSRTLTELNEILLRDAHELSSVLQDIQEITVSAQADGAEAAVERVMEQVDRIRAWGAARQRAWSEYYQYVHRYLCDVVRLDPSRALIQRRLREQLSQHTARPFALSSRSGGARRVYCAKSSHSRTTNPK